MHRAIHRLHSIAHAFRVTRRRRHCRKLVVFVHGQVPGSKKELFLRDMRRVHQVVATAQYLIFNEAAQLELDGSPPRVPQDLPGAHVLLDAEQIEFLTDDTVVALAGFFEAGEVLVEVLLLEPGCSVNPLEHLAALVASPIRPCGVQQLEVVEATRCRQVRSAAEVDERAIGIHRDHLIVAQLFDPLQLERVVLESSFRFVPIDLFAHEGKVLLHHFAHPVFDRCEIFRGEGTLDLEVVVEAIFDSGSEADVRLRIELSHRRSQDVRGRVPQHIESFRLAFRQDFERNGFGDRPF